MPPTPIIDPSDLDLDHVLVDIEGIRKLNQQRYEMEQLTAIVLLDTDKHLIAGYKDVRPDEFWVRGHVPGRPLFPGVLMCESAAQLASYYYMHVFPDIGFLGFGGLDHVRFRGTVEPGDRFVMVGQGLTVKARRCVFQLQGFVGAKMVFQGQIIGLPV